jgi:hypothetical protein
MKTEFRDCHITGNLLPKAMIKKTLSLEEALQ